MEKPKRTVRITSRFTPEEAERIKRIAESKGITVSDLIRRSVLKLKIPERMTPEKFSKRNEVFRRYLSEINKIGANINQIARKCNLEREVDVDVFIKLLEIELKLRGLLKRLYEELTDVDKPSGRQDEAGRES